MKYDEIVDEWSKDCKIDRSDLANESLKVPELHNKYYKIYVKEKLVLRAQEENLNMLLKTKREYYNGDLDESELNENQWQQFDLVIPTKDVMSYYLNGDAELVKEKLKIAKQREKVCFVESIIDNINKRSFLIKNAIEFIKFTNGIS